MILDGSWCGIALCVSWSIPITRVGGETSTVVFGRFRSSGFEEASESEANDIAGALEL